jgi:hypothetical protein
MASEAVQRALGPMGLVGRWWEGAAAAAKALAACWQLGVGACRRPGAACHGTECAAGTEHGEAHP